jgi:hypothetical protein
MHKFNWDRGVNYKGLYYYYSAMRTDRKVLLTPQLNLCQRCAQLKEKSQSWI